MNRPIWIDAKSAYGQLLQARYVGFKLLLSSDVDIDSHPMAELLRAALLDWQTSLWKDKRICFGCGKRCWRCSADERPAAIAMFWAAGLEGPLEIVLAPVCRGCNRRRDAIEHIDRVVSELFPGAKRLPAPVPGPKRLQ